MHEPFEINKKITISIKTRNNQNMEECHVGTCIFAFMIQPSQSFKRQMKEVSEKCLSVKRNTKYPEERGKKPH